MAACAQLVLPVRIKIQPWTRPISFAGTGEIDGLEVLLAAYDFLGDEVKAVGRLHLELYTRRKASADRLGEQVAHWSIDLDEGEQVARHWDRSVRFHRLPLRLASGSLEPGRYVLSARLLTPPDQCLFDEYEFTVEPGSAQPATAP